MRRALAAFLLACLAAPAFSADVKARAEDALRESVLRLAAGDVAGAEASARAAAAADPASVRALQQLARSANAALDFEAAQDAASRAVEQGGATPALLCLRSEARAGRGDYQGALEDANRAARINPGSGQAALRVAVAKEGLRRSPEETLGDYRRAAELDASLAPLAESAVSRLAPPSRPRGGLGALIGILGLAAVVGWTWGRLRQRLEAAPAPSAPRVALPAGPVRLSPREAARALAAAAASAPDPESALALAESLYERLTGRPAFAHDEATIARSLGRFTPASKAAEGLPVGIDAFFARALAADPSHRFRNGAELLGAFRSVVDPAVD